MADLSPVSVIVVSFNTREKLRRCLSCIEPEHEVIVVDNASSDGSADMVASEFPHAKLIRNAENRGFGAANNQGLDVMTREFALFLNSDCYASPGAIQLLADAFDPHSFVHIHAPHIGDLSTSQPSIVATGGKLLNPDDSLQDSVAMPLTLGYVAREQLLLEWLFGGNWVTRELNAVFERSRMPLFPVAQLMGACLMIRPLERFDERYFLYVEDTDLCKRLQAHGSLLWVPVARFTHELGSSSLHDRWKSVALYNRSKELFFAIHKGRLPAAICLLLNRCGALLRLTFWALASILTLFTITRTTSRMGLFAKVLVSPIKGRRIEPT